MTVEMHPDEPHAGGLASRLNWLRAGVLGANDGIVSVAAIVVGVASATPSPAAILSAGAAGLLGGAISMALGEYVSVRSSTDTTEALIAKESAELRDDPDAELAELAALYAAKGLSDETAAAVARELTAHDALAAHLDAELHLDPDDVANPWTAAWASAASFTVGALLPFLTIMLLPESVRIPLTFAAVLVALAATGAVSGRLGGANPVRPVIRNVVGGTLALTATFAVGWLLGSAGVV
ncbi:VIT family protein [Homoserinibacter sp. GY 40078]|uniref:VIT1/CCC1 transporter family protein n=1 Tax=Homoserinibacter sp. GY 40078 TaxID=2603275 RepID=UPI0011C9AF64|nr:VIT family protein [Homoserinibacter sp. GY 40078]TXK18429.1 VIT family protein [Homoserinibacter sp. GY 40078]